MVNAVDIGKIIVVLLLGTAFTIGVATIDLPGTSDADGETTYDLKTTIGVEGTGTDIKINENSYSQRIKESSLFGGLSFTSDIDEFSLTKAENVRMKYTLNGPIESKVKTDNIGEVGKLGGSKSSTFKATNLPCGSYVLHMNLNWNTGSDYYRKNIDIACSGGEN